MSTLCFSNTLKDRSVYCQVSSITVSAFFKYKLWIWSDIHFLLQYSQVYMLENEWLTYKHICIFVSKDSFLLHLGRSVYIPSVNDSSFISGCNSKSWLHFLDLGNCLDSGVASPLGEPCHYILLALFLAPFTQYRDGKVMTTSQSKKKIVPQKILL